MKEKFASSIVIQLSIQIIGLFIAYYKSMVLDVAIIGIIAYSLSITGIFSAFLDLGLSQIHYQYSGNNDYDNYFGSYFALKLVLLSLNYIIPFFSIFFIELNQLVLSLVIINLITGILTAFCEIFTVNLQSRLKILKNGLINMFYFVIYYTGELIILLNINKFSSPALILLLIGLFASFIKLIIIIIANLKEKIKSKPRLDLIKRYLKDTKPFVISSIISVLNTYLGVILLGIDNSYEEIAYYSFIRANIILVLIQFGLSIMNIFNSFFPKLFNENKIKEIQALIDKFEKYASILFLFVIIFIEVNADLIFLIILPNYIPAVKYLRWMIIIPYCDAILRPYSGNLVQSKKQSLSAKYAILHNILSLFLTTILVPNQIFSIKLFGLGSWGLVIVSLFFAIENNIFTRYTSKKYFNLSTNVKYIKHITIGIITLLFGLLIRWFIEGFIENIFLILILTSMSIMIIYVVLMFFLKEFMKEDVKFVIDLIKPSTYIDSFKDEIER